MSRETTFGAVIALAVVAGLLFAGVAVHELSYASDHPHAYGPAKVIATTAGAGAVLSVAVVLFAHANRRSR